MQQKTNVSRSMESLSMMPAAFPSFMAVSRMQAKFIQSALRYQHESLGFMRHRLEQGVKLFDAILAEEETADAFDVISNYVEEAVNDYAAEAAKVASLSSKLSSEAARSLRKETRKAMADSAVKTAA